MASNRFVPDSHAPQGKPNDMLNEVPTRHSVVHDGLRREQGDHHHDSDMLREPTRRCAGKSGQAYASPLGDRRRANALFNLGHPLGGDPSQLMGRQPCEFPILSETAKHEPRLNRRLRPLKLTTSLRSRGGSKKWTTRSTRVETEASSPSVICCQTPPQILLVQRELHRREEGLLVRKMLEQQRFRDPGRVGQRACRRAVEAFFRENPAHGPQDGDSSLLAGELLSRVCGLRTVPLPALIHRNGICSLTPVPIIPEFWRARKPAGRH